MLKLQKRERSLLCTTIVVHDISVYGCGLSFTGTYESQNYPLKQSVSFTYVPHTCTVMYAYIIIIFIHNCL